MRLRRNAFALVMLACLLTASSIANAQGILLNSIGAVNQSMSGASTAAPLDAIGALYWNPATTAALDPELSVGFELLTPVIRTRSAIAGLTGGSNEGEPGTAAIPSVGFTFRQEDSPMTFGLGVYGVAGFRTNYPASTTNPIFTPQSNTVGVPGGFGSLYSQATFLQLAPTVAYAVNENFAIGGGPTLTLGELILDPQLFAAPDDADGSGQPRYPEGRGTRYHWGGGAQLGVYYINDCHWHFGASVKTPQWMEDFRFHTQDELGAPRVARMMFDLPMVVSLGTAYSGIDGLTVAMDLRYFDYKNTDGFGQHGFNPDGSLAGLGMSNIFSVSTGIQYRVKEGMYLRGGYNYNQNPFQSSETAIAVAAPLFYQHQISAGGSMQFSDTVFLNFAYTYVMPASMSGPLITPAGPVAGSTVTTEESAHRATIGITVKH